MQSIMHDIGAYIVAVQAIDPDEITTTGDGVLATGRVIDREANSSYPLLSGSLVVSYKTVLTATKALTLSTLLEHSASTASSTFATLETKDGSTAAQSNADTNATTAGVTRRGVQKIDYDLGHAKRYLRAKVTPTLSATSSDVAGYAAVLVFGGGQTRPAA